MSDVLGMSALNPEGSQPIDAAKIDKNLRHITAIEAGWRLPVLPDEVKLDLAVHGNPEGLTNLLYGIDVDLNKPDPAPVQPPLQTPTMGTLARVDKSFMDDLKVQWAGWNNDRPPQEVSNNAVKQFKVKAIEQGYLKEPTDGVIDDSWTPELNGVKRDVLFNEMNDRYAGNRPGAVSISSAMDMFTSWGTPSGLIRAVTDMGFLPDPAEIQKEFQTWGDKWRKVGDSSGPVDFARNFWDAATGPIDDVLIPVVNDVLLFTGVSEVTAFGKLGLLAERGLTGAKAVEGLYDVGRASETGGILARLSAPFKAADIGADVANFSRPGFLAGKLEGTALSGVGDTMQAWRDLKGVQFGKKVVQQGMRLGVVGQLEGLLPGYGGGITFRDAAPGVSDEVDDWTRNPLVAGVGEAILTPYTIFEHGSIMGLAKALGSEAMNVVARSTTPLGQLGKVPYLGKLQRLQFARVTENGQLTAAFHSAVTDHLTSELDLAAAKAGAAGGLGTETELVAEAEATKQRLIKYQTDFKKSGARTAMKNLYGMDDADLGASMAYSTMAASIDHTASAVAGADRTATGWANRYHTYRNKLIAQLRSYDPNDKEGIALAMATLSTTNRQQLKTKFATILDTITDEQVAATVAKHNDLASRVASNLMSGRNINQDVLQSYLGNNGVMGTFGDWSKFTTHSQELENLVKGGYLKDVAYSGARGFAGGRLNVVPEMKLNPSLPPEDVLDVSTDGWWKTILEGGNPPSYMDWVTKGIFSPLARHVDAGTGKITLARTATVTKQELLERAADIKSKLKLWDRVQRLKSTGDGQRLFTGLGDTSEVSLNQARQLLKTLDVETRGSSKAHAAALMDYMKQENIGWDDLEAHLYRDLQQVDGQGSWAERYDIDSVQRMGNQTLDTFGSLKAKYKQLRQKSNWTAAELDTEKLLNETNDPEVRAFVEGAQRDGYKLVNGVEFMMPTDLHSSAMFGDVTQAHLNTATLGNWFKRQQPEALQELNRRHLRDSLVEHISHRIEWQAANPKKATKAGGLGTIQDMHLGELGPDGKFVPDLNSKDWDVITTDLYDALKSSRDGLTRDLEDAIQNRGWLGRRAQSLNVSATPMNIQDLTQAAINNKLGGLYGSEGSRGLFQAVKGARARSFKEVGAYAIEANLRSRPNAVKALKLLGGSTAGEALRGGVLARAGGAVVGGTAGATIGAQNGPQGGVLGAAVGAGAGYAAGKYLAPKIASTAVGAAVGYETGSALAGSENPDQQFGSALMGGLAGAAVGATGLKGGARVLSSKLEHSDWLRYAYLGEGLAHIRDTFRFKLNPILDAGRYVEAATLGNISKVPDIVTEDGRVIKPLLRFNQSETAMKSRQLKELVAGGMEPGVARANVAQRFEEAKSHWRAATRGDFDPDALDSMGHWVHDYGILGFNPTHWMAAQHAQLITEAQKAGLAGQRLEDYSREAYRAVKEIHTYGVTGRSAAELSTNFILFPFSFQKKMLTAVAQFANQDWSRAVMLHDAYKTYEVLNDRYDLNSFWRDRMPVLEQLQRVNNFAYGISPGRLGGMNAPFISAVMNVFGPQGFDIKAAADGDNVKELMRRTFPIYNDINSMVDDLQRQGHVITSPTHVTANREASDGYQEWNDYKDSVNLMLKARGYQWSSLSSPKLADLKFLIDTKKQELQHKYPGWVESQLRASHNQDMVNIELKDAVLDGQRNIAMQQDTTEAKIYQFEYLQKRMGEELSKVGVSMQNDLDLVPPGLISSLRQVAVDWANQDPKFLLRYRRFWEKKLGPIEASL